MFNIYHDIEIDATPSQIFEMISTSDGLNKWWTVKSSGHAKVGELFNFYFADDYDWYARVYEYEADKVIKFKMEKSDEDWKNTSLSFEIISKNSNKSLLRFEHNGWTEANDHYRRSNYCWATYFEIMKNHLEGNL